MLERARKKVPMERRLMLSVFAVLALMAGAVAGPCADPEFEPGTSLKIISSNTICDVAAQMDESCEDFANALKRFQGDSTDVNVSLRGRTIRLPTVEELDAVRNRIFSVNEQKSVPKKSKKIIFKKVWPKKFATPEQKTMWFFKDHVVRVGESISSIAEKYGNAHWSNPQVLVWFNRLENPNKLHVGQVLAIPDTTHFYWINQNVAPYGKRSLAECIRQSKFSNSVKAELLRIFPNSDSWREGFLRDNQVLETMASAPDSQGVISRPDVVVCLGEGQVLHGWYIETTEGDENCFFFVPDYCNNGSTYRTPAPELPDNPWGDDSVPEYEPYIPVVRDSSPPVDTTPKRGVMPPVLIEKKGPSRNGLYSWGNIISPIPYVVDIQECLGSRGVWFPSAWQRGAVFGKGLNLCVNSWNGVGPRDTVPQSRFLGLRPTGGFAFDRLHEQSRFVMFLNYGVQVEWDWNKAVPSKKYKSFQLNQLFNPSLAWVGTSSPVWSWWLSTWVDFGLDMDNVGKGFDHKKSSFGGHGLTQRQDPRRDKTSINGGINWYFWDISRDMSKNSAIMGPGTKFLHLWEDNRWDVELNWNLDINHWFQLGVFMKDTFNSKVKLQNGWSYGLSVNASWLDIGKYKKVSEGW